MSSSELSDALNPFASRRSSIASTEHYAVTYGAAYVPHRSELEVATMSMGVEPYPRSQHAQQRLDQAQRRPSQVESLAIQKLFCHFHALMEQERELSRDRFAQLEREHEQRDMLRNQEHERRLQEMQNEINQLRAALHYAPNHHTMGFSNGLPSPQDPMVTDSGLYQPPTPASPTFRSLYADGSGANLSSISHLPEFSRPGNRPHCPSSDSASPPATSPDSSRYNSSETPDTSPSPESIPVPYKNKRRARGRSRSPTSRSESSDSTNTSRSRFSRPPRKRLNHRDKRCLTIQHAMRAHFWLMLDADSDGPLPESHIESNPSEDHGPIRFVWDKTTKQSVHNQRMKNRILADIKERRHMYDHVPKKDFGKKILDAAFEQCFTTFRQKFRAQNDEAVALQAKRREEAKSKKARHVSRRKTKLNNRAESRMKLPEFQNVLFDQALQIECMSSEESDMEDGGRSTNTLRTHGYAWRSSRLLRFYCILDQEELSDKSMKPKRGVGKRHRIQGPNKAGDILPPKGIATWMISRRWLKVTKVAHPELPEVLENLVDRSLPFDAVRYAHLGDESEVSDEFETTNGASSPGDSPTDLRDYIFPPPVQMHSVPPHRRSTSSSLEGALCH